MGIPIYEINQIGKLFKYPYIIIASTNEQYKSEMQKMLLDLHFREYWIPSNSEITEMERQIPLKDKILWNKFETDAEHMNRLLPRAMLKFEVHITEHCNLNCRGCFHCSPLAGPEFLDINEWKRDCKRLSELFCKEMDNIILLGGNLFYIRRLQIFLILRVSIFR